MWRWWKHWRRYRSQTNTPVATPFVIWNLVTGGLTIVCVVATVTGVAEMIAKPGAAGILAATVIGVIGAAELCGVCGCVVLRKAVC